MAVKPKEAVLSIRLPLPLRIELERLAEKQERSLGAVTRRAISQYIEAEGIRESLARGHE